MMGRILTIARREFRSYFDHSTAYVLLVVFLGITFFFFFREAYLVGEASLRPMIGLLPWYMLFLVPAVCMRALAEERKTGTLELVLSQPITEVEFLLGKFVGVFGFLAVALSGTLGIPLGLSFGADLQWGVIFAQYAGTAMLVGTLVAIGMWASSLTDNQVTAFILAVTFTFALFAIGLDVVVLGLPPLLGQIAGSLGMLSHFGNIARGVIDLRDVLYFLSVTVAFLALAYHSLMRKKLSPARPAYRRLGLGTLGLVGLAILVSLLGGRIRGRLDLTPGKVYSLSAQTRAVLEDLDDLVTIKFFASDDLPPQFVSVHRDMEDLLRDYGSAGGSNVEVEYLTPEGDNEARREAETLGIQAVTFNAIGQEEQVRRQFILGIAVEYAGAHQSIGVLQRSADMEYRLTSSIRNLTREDQPHVAFLSGSGEATPQTNLRLLGGVLRESYTVETLTLDSLTTQIPDTVDVLAVVEPVQQLSPGAGRAIEVHLERGGAALLMYRSAQLDQRSGMAIPVGNPALDSIVARYGVQMAQGVVYDLRSYAQLNLPAPGGFSYLQPYPLFPLVLAASEHVIVRGLGQVMMPWAAAIDVVDADSASVIPLLATTEFGGRIPGVAQLDPEQNWERLAVDMSPQIVSVALLGSGTSPGDGVTGSAVSAPGVPLGRLVVAGTGDMLTDERAQSNPNGVIFAVNAIDWLAQDEALIAIRSKDRQPPPLLFSSALVRDAVKYGNLIGVPLLFVLYGAFRLGRRRGLQVRAE